MILWITFSLVVVFAETEIQYKYFSILALFAVPYICLHGRLCSNCNIWIEGDVNSKHVSTIKLHT